MTKHNSTSLMRAFVHRDKNGFPFLIRSLLPEARPVQVFHSNLVCTSNDLIVVSQLTQAELNISLDRLWETMESRIAGCLSKHGSSGHQRIKSFKKPCFAMEVAFQGRNRGILSLVICIMDEKHAVINLRLTEKING